MSSSFQQNLCCDKASPKTLEKFILDATAGFRMMWFDKKHPNCIYLDQRPECEPDIVGDFRDLRQFPDETFRLIVFDPPHIVKKDQPPSHTNSNMVRCFGYLKSDTWESDLRQAFRELRRILKPYGILIFKWTNVYVSCDRILKIVSEKPLFYQVSSSRERKGLHGERSREIQTVWFCFMKIPKQEPQA